MLAAFFPHPELSSDRRCTADVRSGLRLFGLDLRTTRASGAGQ